MGTDDGRGRTEGARPCSIADALESVGDRWSLLVVREIGFGVQRFEGICVNTGAPRQILTARLRKLESVGVIERNQYSDRPPRYEYALTAAGQSLLPILSGLRQWGERFAIRSPAVTAELR